MELEIQQTKFMYIPVRDKFLRGQNILIWQYLQNRKQKHFYKKY